MTGTEIEDSIFEKNGSDAMDEYRVVFVIFVGVDSDGNNIYQFLLSDNTDDVFSEGWVEKPASNINNSILMIEADQYEYVKELRTNITLDLAQDNSCLSMQDCRDGIIALAYENIDDYDEYPDGRIVIHFGDRINDVERILAKRDLCLKFV